MKFEISEGGWGFWSHMTWLFYIVTPILFPYFKTMFRAWKRPESLGDLPEGGIIFASNHCSNAEGPMMCAYIHKPVRFLAKQELFQGFWTSFFFNGVGSIPVRRGGSDAMAFERAAKALKAGDYIGIFPEGTRGDGRTLLMPHTGVVRLALLSGAPIVPLGISGGHLAWPKGKLFPRYGMKVTVRYGKPWYVPEPPHGKEYSYDELKVLAKELMFERIAPLIEGVRLPVQDSSSP